MDMCGNFQVTPYSAEAFSTTATLSEPAEVPFDGNLFYITTPSRDTFHYVYLEPAPYPAWDLASNLGPITFGADLPGIDAPTSRGQFYTRTYADLTFQAQLQPETEPAPEPATSLLVGDGCLLGIVWRGCRKSKRHPHALPWLLDRPAFQHIGMASLWR